MADLPAADHLDDLTASEIEELDRLESIIEEGFQSFIAVGNALIKIQMHRLYRDKFRNFDAYCRERWDLSRSRAYQLIDAAKVVGNLSTMVDIPSSERVIRPLSILEPQEQQEAWSRAEEIAQSKAVTSKVVEEAIRQIKEDRPEFGIRGEAEGPRPEPEWDVLAATCKLDRLIGRVREEWPVDSWAALASHLRAHADDLDRSPSAEVFAPAWAVATTPALRRAAPDRPLVYGSVCSGIEAATVAWHPLGWRPAWFAEVAEFPSAVLAERYPDVANHGDFTTIGEEHGPIDLLVGGTPCQAFSVTGLRGGLADERGNLALEYCRLAQRLGPRWLVWENVAGVLSIDDGRAFGAFLGGLAELGYGLAYRVLDAQHFGVPQRRNRVFVVGHRGDWRFAACALFEREGFASNPGAARKAGKEPSRRTGRDAPGLFAGAGCDGGGPIDARPLIYGWNGDETFKYAEGIATTLRASQGGEGVGFATDGVVRNYTAVECERLMGFPDDYTAVPFRGRPAGECPAKRRIHALGNSMAVPVMAWIGGRIGALDQYFIRQERGSKDAQDDSREAITGIAV